RARGRPRVRSARSAWRGLRDARSYDKSRALGPADQPPPRLRRSAVARWLATRAKAEAGSHVLALTLSFQANVRGEAVSPEPDRAHHRRRARGAGGVGALRDLA